MVWVDDGVPADDIPVIVAQSVKVAMMLAAI